MARKLVFFALILLALIALAYANADPPKANIADPPSGGVSGDDDGGDVIGNEDDADNSSDDMAVAAPVGGPAPEGAFANSSTDGTSSPSDQSVAISVEVSSIVGFAAAAASGLLLLFN